MKLSAVSLLVVGAGLAQHVSASPIRVILTEVSTIRFGHAVAPADDAHVAHIEAPGTGILMPHKFASHEDGEQHKEHHAMTHHRHHPGCGHSWREKGVALSNAFRQAMGLPLIEKNLTPAEAEKAIHGGLIHIMTKPDMDRKEGQDGRIMRRPHQHMHHGPHVHQGPPHPSFMRRIHRALMSLGPWEGRAVAFVIGCGLGVLFRMLWVLTVVMYRTMKGDNEEESEYRGAVLVTDVEEIFVAPPHYTDEKATSVDDKSVAV